MEHPTDNNSTVSDMKITVPALSMCGSHEYCVRSVEPCHQYSEVALGRKNNDDLPPPQAETRGFYDGATQVQGTVKVRIIMRYPLACTPR